MSCAGLYIHVPFCIQKCRYCNFYSIPQTETLLEQYTEAVCRNLRYRKTSAVSVDTIYFGGGTPSLLSAEQLERILIAAKNSFSVFADAEITLEANPATVSSEQLHLLRAAGVNRISLGVQSLQEHRLRQLGRLHTAQDAIETVEAAAQAGFSNISCDVMLALPEQTGAELAQTIQNLAALPITHISAYLLKIEAGTPFAKAHMEEKCPDEDAAADLYLEAVAQLEQLGFLQYEISNFAKPGFESRHNQKYWRCKPYLGIGPSAHSCWNGKRFSVPPSVADFLSHDVQKIVLEDGAACARDEEIMLGMRLTEGVPLVWLSDKQEMLERFCSMGFLRKVEDRVAFTPKGFLVSNTILAELL